MKISEYKKVDCSNHDNVTFIRVKPEDISITIRDIILEISQCTWLDRFNKEYLRASFEAKAEPTIKYICDQLRTGEADSLNLSSIAAEYVVSELARESIVNKLDYLDIPLSEIYSKQKSNNPGFDFHTVNKSEIVIFGESKYVNGKNAYGSALSQINDFVNENKDIKDISDLATFCTDTSLDNAFRGIKGFAAAFSSTAILTETLIRNILENNDYKKLLNYSEIILVAVDMVGI